MHHFTCMGDRLKCSYASTLGSSILFTVGNFFLNERRHFYLYKEGYKQTVPADRSQERKKKSLYKNEQESIAVQNRTGW